MFDRIEVNVVNVLCVVAFIAQGAPQYRRCQMPRSPLRKRLGEIRSPAGRARENVALISRQRVAKSGSPSGNDRMAWR
jgi:hypothetical protein